MSQASEVPDELIYHPDVVTFSPYWEPRNANRFAVNLMHFGYGQFHRVLRIKYLDHLRQVAHAGPLPTLTPELIEMGLDGVIDAIRICMCFENYMKAQLVRQGFLIHTIDSNSADHKAIAREQRRRPVLLSEVVNISGWVADVSTPGIARLPYVQTKTLAMSNLLGPGYQSLIRLPADVLAFVCEQNEARNHLHLYKEDRIQVSPDIVRTLENVIEFVDTEIVGLHNELINNDNGLAKHMLIRPRNARAYSVTVEPLN